VCVCVCVCLCVCVCVCVCVFKYKQLHKQRLPILFARLKARLLSRRVCIRKILQPARFSVGFLCYSVNTQLAHTFTVYKEWYQVVKHNYIYLAI